MYIVRYADDFKIMCKSYEEANKTLKSVKEWLNLRLKLEVSEEKTKITNVKKHSTEFLGFKLKAYLKGKKYIVQSHICEKAKEKIKANIAKRILAIKEHTTCKNVCLYNATILGVQEYYKIATMVSQDLAEIAYILSKKLRNRIKSIESKTGSISILYKKRYKNNYKVHFVCGIALFPLMDIQTKPPKLFNQNLCNFTEEGRRLIHDNLIYINPKVIKYLLINPEPYSSTQFNDNRLSLYAAQKGLCGISGEILKIGHMEVHHILPKQQGGTDTYKNLIYLTDIMHKLVHGSNEINNISNNMKAHIRGLSEKQLKRLNKYRKIAGNKEYNLEELL